MDLGGAVGGGDEDVDRDRGLQHGARRAKPVPHRDLGKKGTDESGFNSDLFFSVNILGIHICAWEEGRDLAYLFNAARKNVSWDIL